MRVRLGHLGSLGLGAVLVLTGCTADADDTVVETVVVTVTDEPGTADHSPQPARAAANPAPDVTDVYRGVLQNPPTHPEDRLSRFHPTGTWSYALVEATGDDRPDLLLKVDGREFSRIHLYTTGDNGELVRSAGYLIDGAADAGGSRARVVASRSGAGVYQVDHMSMQREGTSTLYRLEGTSLVETGEPTVFEALGALGALPDHEAITWTPTTDESALTKAPAPTPAEDQVGPAAGTVRFTGVVAEKSTREVLRGSPVPNGEPESNRYYLLILDEPMTVTAHKALGRNTETVSEIRIGEKSSYYDDSATWGPLVGTRITIDATDDQMGFPSDTSLPLGMLRVRGTIVGD